MNRFILSSIFLALFVAISNLAAAQFATIPPKQMADQAAKQKAVYLDVRTPQEWQKGHVKGATHIDLFSDDFEARLKKLDPKKTYYVYCAVGGRSAEAASMMVKMGFKQVYNMQGGFKAWEQQGLPAEK